MKKSLAVLSLVLVAMFTLTSIPVSAGYYSSETAQGFYLDFETVADYNTANGGIYGNVRFYNYVSGEGVGANGTNGALKLSPASISNESGFTNGFDTSSPLEAEGVTYRLSFKYKAPVGATSTSVWPMIRAIGATGAVINAGDLTSGYDAETMTYTGGSPYRELAKQTTVTDGNWHDYSAQFSFGEKAFGLGSTSTVTVTGMEKLRVIFRMNDDGNTGTTNETTELFIDDVVIEPVGIENYPEDFAYTAPYVGEEILPATRTITTHFSSNVSLGQSAAKSLVSAGTDVVIEDNGRGTVKTAGQSGDMAYMAVAASGECYVRFQGQSDASYKFANKLGEYEIYQVTVRAKAPEFVIDETITDSKYYVSSDGTVKVASGTNGKIGGALKATIYRSSTERARSVYFTGVAAGSAPALTTEWVDYVGYTYFKPSEAITWASIPYIEVNVAGDAGIFYVDELSIKPVVSENLILNGDMTINVPCRYPNHTDYVAPLGIVPNCEDGTQANMLKDSTGLYVYNSNGATTYREVNTKAVLEAGKTYKLEVRERMKTAGATGTLAIDITKGDATQTITSGVTVYDTFKTYSFTFSPSADVVAANALDVASINFKTTRDASATSDKSYYYEYFRLTEVPEAYVEDITVTGSMTELATITASWDKMPEASTATQIVKVSIGNDTDGYSMIDVSSTIENTKTVILSKGTAGKKVKVEVISYVDGEAVSSSSYVTEGTIAEAVEGITISDATKGASAFSANVTYVGSEDAFIIIATYDNYNKMITLATAELAKDGTVSPVSVTTEGATYAKVFVFDGTSLSDTKIKPMCDCVEIR